jgi:alkylhydroperoxidase family enzyme
MGDSFNGTRGGEMQTRSDYGLSAWREAPHYSARERAALAWAEAVTNIRQIDESDEEYEAARAQFSAEELIKLTVVVSAINGGNRLATAFREPAGT